LSKGGYISGPACGEACRAELKFKGSVMGNFAKTTTKLKAMDQDEQSANGLQNLVTYYQKLFDRKENRDHYSPEDYQNAKRCFVKYLLKNRGLLEG
jgi:hypothetical protein